MPTITDVPTPCPERAARRQELCSCDGWLSVWQAHDMWYQDELPECGGDYIFGKDPGFVSRCREIDVLLQQFWFETTLIERQVPCPQEYFYGQTLWQICDTRGPSGAWVVKTTIEMWADESVGLDRNTPGLAGKVAELLSPEQFRQIGRPLLDAVRARPVKFEIPRAHRKVHEVAERQGSWMCAYCGIGLIDVCRDGRDIEADQFGLRLIASNTRKRLPTLDHIVPRALGGSNSVRNLVLACQPCNSAKGAR